MRRTIRPQPGTRTEKAGPARCGTGLWLRGLKTGLGLGLRAGFRGRGRGDRSGRGVLWRGVGCRLCSCRHARKPKVGAGEIRVKGQVLLCGIGDRFRQISHSDFILAGHGRDFCRISTRIDRGRHRECRTVLYWPFGALHRLVERYPGCQLREAVIRDIGR